eukprot:TRINITY_DN8999_c0_g1_i1.p1 TRINITY_DN8999_c0_g1~~TRINITY_DN8999_c0_g1_i1.p1  ORF type:complete len:142 (-),score=20.15 TRINITY_DN8999_c0_g1_i1:133-558(-)
MMCKRCGNINPTHSLYCSLCGVKDVHQNWNASCKTCGAGNQPGSAFCNHCGSSVAQPEQIAQELEEMVENRKQMQGLLSAGFLTQQEYDIRRLQLVHEFLSKDGKDISKPPRKTHTRTTPTRSTRSASSPEFPVNFNKDRS